MVSRRVFCVFGVLESLSKTWLGTCPSPKTQPKRSPRRRRSRSKRGVHTCLLLRDPRQALHMVGGRVSEVVEVSVCLSVLFWLLKETLIIIR